MIIEQDTFSAGLDLVSSDTQINSAGYLWLINARQRYGFIEPNRKPTLINAPAGKKQGIIAIGNITILIVAGQAYFKFFDSAQWNLISNFTMSPTVDQVYLCTIPASSLDYTRKLNPSGSISDAMIRAADSRPLGTPSGIVVQDGITQPFFLTFNEVTQTFQCRQLKTYAQWLNSPTGMEYVPIGTIMMYLEPILFIVAPDKQSVYRSVSGQPLNFMVNVDFDGNKLATEDLGGAASTSFAFDYDPITNLTPVNIQNAFMYCTRQTSRVIQLDYTNTIFDEPLFARIAIIDVGTLNQYSVLDLLGDYALIDYEGVTTFNAVQTYRFQGRNSIFSKQLSKLIRDIKQSEAICFRFNNYAIFNVDTIWGNVLAVWDMLLQQWVSVDITKVSKIKQFALIDIIDETRLYVITAYDEVYQLYDTAQETETPCLYTRSYTVAPTGFDVSQASYSTVTEIKSDRLDLIFHNGTIDGEVTCQEIVDDSFSKAITKPLDSFTNSIPFPVIPPVIPTSKPKVDRVTFNYKDFIKGYKIAYLIKWNTDASLKTIRLVTSDINAPVGVKQQETVYKSTYKLIQSP